MVVMMNNADMPAMLVPDSMNKYEDEFRGITKREHFAAMAMQGLTASGEHNAMGVVIHAVIMADALLLELEQDHG